MSSLYWLITSLEVYITTQSKLDMYWQRSARLKNFSFLIGNSVVVISRYNKQYKIYKNLECIPAVTSSSDRLLNRRNCIIWTLREKGTYLGRVDEPTIAKFAPFENVDPIDSKYGLRKLVFTFWPAVKIILISQIYTL